MKVWADIFTRANSSIFLIAGLGLAYVDQLKKSNQRIRFLMEQNDRLKKQQLETHIAMQSFVKQIADCKGDRRCIDSLARQVLNNAKNSRKI